MKKILFLLAICISCSVCSFAASDGNYTIDDQKVEQLFVNSVDVSLTAMTGNSLASAASTVNMGNSAYFKGTDKSFAVAIILNFFLGGLGIHRLYLGTETLTWVGYILSACGIFGVVPFIDFIVLIVHNDDISAYVDNPKYFMWGGGNM
jgi:TM2 domain-containing membrane protein YozV